jgi:hypothetical protein
VLGLRQVEQVFSFEHGGKLIERMAGAK